jgi:hypothetical protein
MAAGGLYADLSLDAVLRKLLQETLIYAGGTAGAAAGIGADRYETGVDRTPAYNLSLESIETREGAQLLEFQGAYLQVNTTVTGKMKIIR